MDLWSITLPLAWLAALPHGSLECRLSGSGILVGCSKCASLYEPLHWQMAFNNLTLVHFYLIVSSDRIFVATRQRGGVLLNGPREYESPLPSGISTSSRHLSFLLVRVSALTIRSYFTCSQQEELRRYPRLESYLMCSKCGFLYEPTTGRWHAKSITL
jgi:hypothetical protein